MNLRPILLPCLFLFCLSYRAEAQRDSIPMEGIKDRVEILRDRWGIAHIYANNEADLFFAQGYNAARDRLFQLELWRRQATGTTAEILGKRALKRDTGSRLHMFRGDIRKELNHYHPRGEQIINSFIGGINAFVRQTDADPSLLPREFRLLGIKPGKWTAEVVISRHAGLMANALQELGLGRAVANLGPDKVRELSWFRPGKPEIKLDPAMDASLLSENILDLYSAFRDPIDFTPADIIAGERSRNTGIDRLALLIPGESWLLAQGESIGSNNWTIAGSRTASGFPLLANDPHRVIQAPSLRYWVHLIAPGWNVLGGGEPSLPGVSIGHNQNGAWGLTIFGQDSEDLYVYETNPANPRQYRYKDTWEDMKIIRDSIPVKGEAPVSVDLKYTRHGPVLFEDSNRHKAVALRAAWMEIGSAPYLASLRIDQSANWEEFREACSYSNIPALNMVWADTGKNIGYQAVGISPIRRNFSGLVPVPGDGHYEWDGYLPIRDLPHHFNPEKGFHATANNYQVPDGYTPIEALHYVWGDELRGARLEELLREGRMQTTSDMMRIQHDELSLMARTLVPLLRDLKDDDPFVEKSRRVLLSWDFVLDRDSVAAAIYVSWERRLTAELRNLLVPKSAQADLGPLNLKRVMDWVLAPDGRFGNNPLAGRDAMLLSCLRNAVADLKSRLGPDTANWQYGQNKFKHALIRHPLSKAVKPELQALFDVGPAPRGGYASTLNATGAGDNQMAGASFRFIADTGNWDNCLGTNAPGQSGNPDSPHYRDLFELWAKGKYFPVFYSREKIESVTEEKMLIVPKQ